MSKFNERTVLIADDIASLREALGTCLRKLGFKDITTAVDGKDAWAKLKDKAEKGTPVELIFLILICPTAMELISLK